MGAYTHTHYYITKNLHFHFHEGPIQSMSQYLSDSNSLLYPDRNHNMSQNLDR